MYSEVGENIRLQELIVIVSILSHGEEKLT